MKKTFLLSLALLPLSLLAQPTIHHMEDHAIGDQIININCDPIAAGPSGASQIWNFGSLTVVDSSKIVIISNPIPAMFPTANYVQHSVITGNQPDSTFTFFDKTATNSYQVGIVDSSSSSMMYVGAITYTNPQLAGQRPVTYTNTASNSYTATAPIIGGGYLHVSGTINFLADGYGTLTTPAGTFTNALRIKMTQIQYDTAHSLLGNDTAVSIDIIYLWYDDAHAAPLLNIDSNWSYDSTNGNSSGVSVYYLKSDGRTGVEQISSTIHNLTACFNNNNLLLTGEFEQGKLYDTYLINTAGEKIYAGEFTSTNNTTTINTGNNVLPGMYIVLIKERGDPAINTIKVVKQ